MGHWWTEIGTTESYGWWPKSEGTLWDAMFGTEGELNAISHPGLGGTPTRDPHHGDTSEESFHPKCSDQSMDDAAVHQAMRSFAASYRGSWRWSLGGTDCHTFQEKLLGAAKSPEPSALDQRSPGAEMAAAEPRMGPQIEEDSAERTTTIG
jgi:hypothetical protein